MKICEPPPCDCVCHKLGYVSHCERCKPAVSEPPAELVHLEAPKTSKNEGENVFCPVKKELTRIFLGHSADGMEVYACAACREPEPETREVTQGALNAVYSQFHRNQ